MWENGQGLLSHRRILNDNCTKTFGPTLPLPSALTSVLPSTCQTAFRSHLPASWGLNLALGQPQRDPSQGTWHRNTGDWGHLNINDRLTLPPGHNMGPMECHCSFSLGERTGPSVHMATFERAPCQNPWGHAQLSQGPHLFLLLCSLHSLQLRSAGLQGANPSSFGPMRGPFPGAWHPNAGDGGLPSLSARLTLSRSHHMG